MIEYNIDQLTVKIDAAAKEDRKTWANEKSAALVADFLAHDTKTVYNKIKRLIPKESVDKCFPALSGDDCRQTFPFEKGF